MTTRQATNQDAASDADPGAVADPTNDGDGGNSDGDGDGDGDSGLDVEDLVTRIGESVTGKIDSAIDSRITKLMGTLRRDYGLEKVSKAPSNENQSGSQPVSDPNAKRFLRAAVRDRIAVEFEDAEQKRLATELASPIVNARGLGADEDEDVVAGELVEGLRKTIVDLTESVEASVTADLKRRGLLKQDAKPPGQQPKGKNSEAPGEKTDTEKFREGQRLAQEKFGQKE